MLTWSTSTPTSVINRSNGSKVAEDFLNSWDSAVYEQQSTGDPELDEEAKLWREKFPHLRITGKNCEKGTQKLIKNSQKLLSQSKSAYTFREKNRERSLPKLAKK